jgi:hypothetical protein
MMMLRIDASILIELQPRQVVREYCNLPNYVRKSPIIFFEFISVQSELLFRRRTRGAIMYMLR